MKILVISNLFPPDHLGGYELGCRQVADALRLNGHEVSVITSVPRNHDGPTQPHVSRSLRLIDVYDQHYQSLAGPICKSIRNQEAYGVHAFNVHMLGQIVEELKPDVAYVWNIIGLGGMGLLAALQQLGVPWVMHLMDDIPRSLCAFDRDGPVIAAVSRAFSRLCQGRFICCSQTTLDEITIGGVPIADRTVIVPNWVTTNGKPGRSDYMPDGCLRIVSAGAISASKGMDILIRAAGLLRDRGHDNFVIDLFGPDPNPFFASLIRTLDLTDRVHLMGPRTQDELYELFASYDVFAFPTWAREPFGFAPMEAMAHGCLAVVSRVCGFAEWFVDGLDCLKADRNPSAFADRLERVIRGEIPIAEMGRRGSRAVLQHFRLPTLIPRIEVELADAIRSGCGPRRTMAEAYRIALLAEKTLQCLTHEVRAA